MSFSKTYREIEDMLRRALLETKTARAIVRKSMVRPTSAEEQAFSGFPLGLGGQYAQVDSGSDSQYGSIVTYRAATEFAFPLQVGTLGLDFSDEITPLDDGQSRLRRMADWRDVDEMRLIVTITKAGLANSELHLRIYRDVYWGTGGETGFQFEIQTVPFAVGSPTVALDQIDLHVTDWQAIDWPAEATNPETGERPALVEWFVNNPSASTGSVGVGLCQLQARPALV